MTKGNKVKVAKPKAPKKSKKAVKKNNIHKKQEQEIQEIMRGPKGDRSDVFLPTAHLDLDKRVMSREQHDNIKKRLQVELIKAQEWVKETQQRVILSFNGVDSAGKGGTITRLTQNMNPRGFKVVALDKPTPEEKSQWYFQRYTNHFPHQGEIVIFDRCYHNRACVDKVMGFCTEFEYKSYLKDVPHLERMWTQQVRHEDNEQSLTLFKFWLSISQTEQMKRFNKRRNDPLRRWKLSPVDIASASLWNEYMDARNVMFDKTHTKHAPWIVVHSDDKRVARLSAMMHILYTLPYPDKDPKVVMKPNPNIVMSADIFDYTNIR